MQTHTHMVSDPYSCLALLLPCFLTHITKPNPTGVLCFSLSSPSRPVLSICLHDHSNLVSPPQKGMLRNVLVPLQGNTSVNLPLSRPDPRHTSETPCMTWRFPPGQLPGCFFYSTGAVSASVPYNSLLRVPIQAALHPLRLLTQGAGQSAVTPRQTRGCPCHRGPAPHRGSAPPPPVLPPPPTGR